MTHGHELREDHWKEGGIGHRGAKGENGTTVIA